MPKDSLKIRSTISASLLKSTLFWGYGIASLGIIILVVAGSYLQIEYLHRWGWMLFLLAIGCITLGMLPYRRLSHLQLKPNELILLNHDHVLYTHKGKQLFSIPLKSISHTRYISHPSHYGIALWLKSPLIEPIRIYQSPEEVEKMRRKADQIDHADLFFPYFNQRAYEEWLDWQDEGEAKFHFE